MMTMAILIAEVAVLMIPIDGIQSHFSVLGCVRLRAEKLLNVYLQRKREKHNSLIGACVTSYLEFLGSV